MEEIITPILIFAFALGFYVTSMQENCWYRRYIIPGLFVTLALVNLENFVAFVILLIAAILFYYGYRG